MNGKQLLLSKGNTLLIFTNAAVIAAALLISLLLLITLTSHLAESTSPLDILSWCLMLTIKFHHFSHLTGCPLVVRHVSCYIASRIPLLRVQHSVEITAILVISGGLKLRVILFFLHLFKITILIRS